MHLQKIAHMVKQVRILSSKKLSKSFKLDEKYDIWESILFDINEAQEIIVAAIKRLKDDSEPLTITITPI